MYNFTKEFNNFIKERIENNVSKLKENIEYMNKLKEFEEKLKSSLNKEQKEKIDYILSLHTCLSDYEITESYILGFKDSIRFNVDE